MRVEREVFRLEEFGSFSVGSVFEQDGAENGLFRVDVGGQAGFEGEIGNGGHRKECRAKSDRQGGVKIEARNRKFRKSDRVARREDGGAFALCQGSFRLPEGQCVSAEGVPIMAQLGDSYFPSLTFTPN